MSLLAEEPLKRHERQHILATLFTNIYINYIGLAIYKLGELFFFTIFTFQRPKVNVFDKIYAGNSKAKEKF